MSARRNSEAGFTLIELMVGVAVIGAMAAVAVPMFTGSVKQAKSADVKAELMKMAMAAKVAYLNDGTFPQGTAQVLPAADGGNCRYKNHMIPVSGAWRDDAIWGNLDVMVSQPTQFSYHYTSSEAGLATITATADLNCDGILTTYSITVIDGVYDVASLETPTTSVAMGDELLDSDDDLETPTMSLPPDMGLPEDSAGGPSVPSEPIVTAAGTGGDVTPPAAGGHHDDGEHEDDDHDGHSGNSGHDDDDDDHHVASGGNGHDDDDDDHGNDNNHSGLGDGTNPGQGAGTGNSPNTGTDNPNNSGNTGNSGNDNNHSGLGDGTNPGQGAGTGNSPNTGTDNPNNSNHDDDDDDDDHGHGKKK